MRKFVIATLAALTLGTAAFAQPADARCWWNGFAWVCSHPVVHSWRWHHSAWCHWHPYRC
jgi:hypothetical protein